MNTLSKLGLMLVSFAVLSGCTETLPVSFFDSGDRTVGVITSAYTNSSTYPNFRTEKYVYIISPVVEPKGKYNRQVRFYSNVELTVGSEVRLVFVQPEETP